MKKIQAYIIATASLLAFVSCKKKEIISDSENLGVGSYLALVSTTNLRLDYSNLSSTSVQIAVKKVGSPVSQIKIYTSAGNITYDKTQWKLVKTVSYTGDSTVLNVKATELAAAFGIPPASLSPGGIYSFYNQIITQDGRTIDVTNESSSALNTVSNYNGIMTWQAVIVCPFSSPMAGNYKVIEDDWADWSPGDIVPVTDGPGANQINISQVWPNPAYGSVVNPLVVTVDQPTGIATVPKTYFGDYGGGYNMTAQGDGSNNFAGYVFTCTGVVTLHMFVKADGPGGNGANFGSLKLILQKQ